MLYEFTYPVRCRLVKGKQVALPGDRVTLTPEQARGIAKFIKPVGGVVTGSEPAKAPEAKPPQDKRINLNTASKDELRSLRHVGVVTAQKIIDARPLTSLDDARIASELNDEQWAAIVGFVRI